MDALEDNQPKLISEKIVPSLFLVLLFITRFLPFYAIKGLQVVTGFGSIESHKILFGTTAVIFLIGTWGKNIHVVFRLVLQNISVFAMMLYEILYLFSEDYYLKHASIGFWCHATISIISIGYCLLTGIRATRKHK